MAKDNKPKTTINSLYRGDERLRFRGHTSLLSRTRPFSTFSPSPSFLFFSSYIRSLSRKRKFFRRIASRYRYLISVPPPGILGSSKRGLRVSVCTGSRTCLCLQSPQYRCFSSPSLRALRFESEHVEREGKGSKIFSTSFSERVDFSTGRPSAHGRLIRREFAAMII